MKNKATYVDNGKKTAISTSLVAVLTFMAVIGHAFADDAPLAIAFQSVLIYILGLFVVYLLAEDRSEQHRFLQFYSLAFFVRIIYSIALYYWMIDVNGRPFAGGGDDEMYERHAQEYLYQWKFGEVEIAHYHPGYLYVLAALTWLGEATGGYHHILPRIFNIFIGSLTVIYIYKLAKYAYGFSVARLAIIFAALWPSFLYYSSLQLRDVLIVFFVVFVAANAGAMLTTRRWLKYALLIVLGLYGLYLFRALLSVVMFGAIGFAVFMGTVLSKKGYISAGKNVLILFAFVVFAVLAVSANLGRFQPGGVVGAVGSGGDLLNADYIGDKVDRQTTQAKDEAIGTTSIGAKILTKFPFPTNLLVTPVIGSIMPYPPWLYLNNAPAWFVWPLLLNDFPTFLIMPLVLIGIFWNFVLGARSASMLIFFPWIFNLMAASSVGFVVRYYMPVYPFSIILACYCIAVAYSNKSQGILKRYYILIHSSLLSVYIVMKTLIF